MIHSQHTRKPWHNYGPIIHAAGKHIAYVKCDKVHLDGNLGSDEQRANARLIALAPEMFDMLVRFLHDTSDRSDFGIDGRCDECGTEATYPGQKHCHVEGCFNYDTRALLQRLSN